MQEKIGELSHRITPFVLSEYPEFLRCLLLVKRACALANSGTGALPKDIGLNIAEACGALLTAEEFSGFLIDPYSGGGGILINTNVNLMVAQAAGLKSPEQVNQSQSTADTCASAMRIALWHLTDGLCLELEASAKIMRENQTKFMHSAMMARTCLQDAMPTNLGTLFEGYAEFCERRCARLRETQKNLLQLNLGGTVIGSGEGATDNYRALVLEILKEESGLPFTRRASLYDAAQNADDIGQLVHDLSLLAEGMIKIAKDLRLLASGPKHGFGDIVLPKVIPGSSFFKNKSNPTIPETVLQACFLVLGKLRTSQAAIEHAELNLNVFEYCAGFATYEALEILANALVAWNQHCLTQIKTSEE